MQGDFEAFYLRHFKAIYRVCYAFMKNASDAEDCTEDAFVKAYRRISTSSCGMAKAYFDAYESVCGQPLPVS